jgi:predicted DNA-binding transcriptional regulator AlpA
MTQREFSEMALALVQGNPAAACVSLPHLSDHLPTKIVYLTATQVRARYGGVSDMTLWRWLRDKDLGFPKPCRINRLRYWKDSELTEWERTRRPDGEAA